MRPTGVTIIGVLQVIGGVLRLLSSVALLGLVGLGLAGGVGDETGGTILGIALVGLVVGLAYFYLGWSMLRLRPWAWTATLILNVIALASVVATFVVSGFDWGVAFGVIIPAIIVYYLYRPQVRAAFRRQAGNRY